MNLKESALGIFRTLQSDPIFEHFGKDSRSVVLSTDSMTRDLTSLAGDTTDPYAKTFITFASYLSARCWDEGTLVRIKNKYNIEIRGADSTLPDESDLNKLYPSLVRMQNKIIIDLNEGAPSLQVKLFLGNNSAENDRDEDAVQEVIDQIPERAKEAMINGILGIITKQVNLIVNT